MRRALTLLIALLCANLALAQNKPLACQVDASAGLKWKHGQWRLADFGEREFILVLSGDTLTKESVASTFPVPELSDKSLAPWTSCSTDKVRGEIRCWVMQDYLLIFNPNSNQGGTSMVSGVTDGNIKYRDSIAIEAFTCQPY